MKPETQNRRLERMGLAKPGETRGLMGTGPGLARQESAGRVFGQFWNRTDPFLLSKPGLLVGYPDPLLTLAFGDLYLSTISNKLSLNPCHCNCCHSPRSQLYPPCKFCKILQHTDNSVPCGHHSDARTRGIKTYLRCSHV